MERINKPLSTTGAYSQLALDKALRDCMALYNAYEELNIIRTHLKEGSYDANLHKVVNVDNSLLQELGCYLPPVMDGVSCESLTNAYLVEVEATMESFKEGLKKTLDILIAAFKEWILDWWDNNRRYRIKLRRTLAELKINILQFGTREMFEKMETNCYQQDAWNTMVDACKNITDILTTLPSDDIDKWFVSKKAVLNNYFKEFGISLDDNMTISKGDQKYDRDNRRMDTARWQYTKLQMYVGRAIDLIGDEIDMRKDLERINKAYKTATGATEEEAMHVRHDLMFAIDLIKAHKTNVGFVCRNILAICDAAKHNANKK